MKEDLEVVGGSNIENELSNVEKLLEYEKQGYLFHGSPDGSIEKLNPKQAKHSGEEGGFNDDLAVFASDTPIAPAIFACMKVEKVVSAKLPGRWGVGKTVGEENSQIKARIPLKWKKYIMKNRGFVYVLPKSGFMEEVKDGWQVKSKNPVKPIDVVEVEFKDFEKLGGIIEWQDD